MDNQRTTDGQPMDNGYYTREEFDWSLRHNEFVRIACFDKNKPDQRSELWAHLDYIYEKNLAEEKNGPVGKRVFMSENKKALQGKGVSFKVVCVIFRPWTNYVCAKHGFLFTGSVLGIDFLLNSFCDPYYKPTKDEFQRFLSMPIPERPPYACANCGAKMEYNKKTGTYEHI